jgi:hypothetical protein
LPWIACRRTGAPPSTSATVESNLAVCVIPAGALGVDGCLEIKTDWVAATQAGTAWIRYQDVPTGSLGVAYASAPLSANTEYRDPGKLICNTGSASAQQGYAGAPHLFTRTLPAVTSAVNTVSPSYVMLQGSVTAGGTVTLYDYTVLVHPTGGL